MIVFWFRRDLRLEDNTALYYAFQENELVLPIFIFDKTILFNLEPEDARVTFIHTQLLQIQHSLQKHGKKIAVFYGDPLLIIKDIVNKNTIRGVYCNHDYEPSAIERDQTIEKFLHANQIFFKTFKDQVIFEKSEVIKENGSPYLIYTPYSKKWKELYFSQNKIHFNAEKYVHKIVEHAYPFLSLIDIGFKHTKINIPNYNFQKELIENYEIRRNYPAIEGTSKIGIYLRFGIVSIRKIVEYARSFENKTYLNELIWREFFMQILWHFPQTVHTCFKPRYDFIEWENNELLFKKWCAGETGYPIVDAGMRELNSTGFMHNRVRMIVASFLCKHLLIDWKWGEKYFALKLLDYEQSSNVGNWQWAAGCGVDAAPYFRIFNPSEQTKKFDAAYLYIKKWVPEWQSTDYIPPIVEHRFARERCLRVFRKALN